MSANTYNTTSSGDSNALDFNGYGVSPERVETKASTNSPRTEEDTASQTVTYSDGSTETVNMNKVSARTRDTIRLAQMADVEALPVEDFMEYAELSLNKNQQVQNRIAVVQDIVLFDDVPEIDLNKIDTEAAHLSRVLIGTDIIGKKQIRCLNKLAYYSEAPAAYEDIEDPIEDSAQVLTKMFDEDRIDESFPKFGIEIILIAVYVTLKMLLILIFGKLCALAVNIVKPIPMVGKHLVEPVQEFFNMGATLSLLAVELAFIPSTVWLFIPMTVLKVDYSLKKMKNIKKMRDRKEKVSMEYRREAIRISIGGVPLWELNDDKGKKLKTAINDSNKLIVCGEIPFNLEDELRAINAQTLAVHGIQKPDTDENGKPINKCSSSYSPTYTERNMARQISEAIIRWELDATSGSPLHLNPNAVSVRNNQPFTKYSMLEKMKTDAQLFYSSSKFGTQQIQTSDGYFVADKIDAGMIGLFVAGNGLLQKIDKAITDILAMNMISAELRGWICCVVRFIFIMLPRMYMFAKVKTSNNDAKSRLDALLAKEEVMVRIAAIYASKVNDRNNSIEWTPEENLLEQAIWEAVAGNTRDEEVLAILKDTQQSGQYKDMVALNLAFRNGIVNTLLEKAAEKTKDIKTMILTWVDILDAILSALTGTVSIELNLEGFNMGKIFEQSIKMALAEAMSMIATSLYKLVKEKLFGVFQGFKKVPDLAFALESCVPINWLMNMLENAIESFFARIQEILAQIWADGNSAMENIDSILSIAAAQSSITWFRDLLALIFKWDQAIVNFCSLNKTATEMEKRAIIDKMIDSSITGMYNDVLKNYAHDHKKTIEQKHYESLIAQSSPAFDETINTGPEAGAPAMQTRSTYPVGQVVDTLKTAYAEDEARDPTISMEQRGALIIKTTAAGNDPYSSPPLTSNPTPKEQVRAAIKDCGDQMKEILLMRLDTINEIHKSVQ